MPLVNLPPGCRGLHLEDGTHYRARREGGTVVVSDEHAAAIDRIPGNGTAGLVTAGFRAFGGGVRNGRWCRACNRLWQPWTLNCNRCGAETVPE